MFPIIEEAFRVPRRTKANAAGLHDRERLTLLALAAHADARSRLAYPSVRRLAEIVQGHPATIRRHLRVLETLGLIRAVGGRAGGRGRSVCYLVFPEQQNGKASGMNASLSNAGKTRATSARLSGNKARIAASKGEQKLRHPSQNASGYNARQTSEDLSKTGPYMNGARKSLTAADQGAAGRSELGWGPETRRPSSTTMPPIRDREYDDSEVESWLAAHQEEASRLLEEANAELASTLAAAPKSLNRGRLLESYVRGGARKLMNLPESELVKRKPGGESPPASRGFFDRGLEVLQVDTPIP